MISFRFTRSPGQEPESGFDLGDMEIDGDQGSLTSIGHSPDQGMMIFLSLALLLGGLARLETKHRGSFSFGAVDSSFQVDFRVKKGAVAVSQGRRTVGRPPLTELYRAVLAAAEEFAARELPKTPMDAGREDLELSLSEFRQFLAAREG
ncbi:hypothetical protein ACH4E7_25205 [Kitasatospora sp. NPDC018058]|uniref:hypothetical protein n=1 Tax=Kitasatospora sp. NPDC018058 TaxID=3364025 RepID=UPI0037BF6D4A